MVYPSNLDALTAYARERGLALPSLQHIRTIGETLHPRVRDQAKAQFGARLSDCYSSQEVGIMALECPAGGLYHVMGESLIVEILDPAGAPCEEGEVGRVVVTDLHNFATPIVRYDIGDYAEASGVCPCGRGLPTLRRIVGRERNLILMPDGTRHWPLAGGRYLREVAPVVQFQVIQHDRKRIEVRLVVESPLSAEQEAHVRAMVERSLRHPFAVDLVYFDGALPKGPGGKFEEFVSYAKTG